MRRTELVEGTAFREIAPDMKRAGMILPERMERCLEFE